MGQMYERAAMHAVEHSNTCPCFTTPNTPLAITHRAVAALQTAVPAQLALPAVQRRLSQGRERPAGECVVLWVVCGLEWRLRAANRS